jgi:hypothetical protein
MSTTTNITRTAVLDEAHIGDIRGALGTILGAVTGVGQIMTGCAVTSAVIGGYLLLHARGGHAEPIDRT